MSLHQGYCTEILAFRECKGILECVLHQGYSAEISKKCLNTNQSLSYKKGHMPYIEFVNFCTLQKVSSKKNWKYLNYKSVQEYIWRRKFITEYNRHRECLSIRVLHWDFWHSGDCKGILECSSTGSPRQFPQVLVICTFKERHQMSLFSCWEPAAESGARTICIAQRNMRGTFFRVLYKS